MRTFDFQCGGGRGAWECIVSVPLSETEISVLKEYAKDNEHLELFPPTDKIYLKVIGELEKQCDEDADLDNVVIWVPFGIN